MSGLRHLLTLLVTAALCKTKGHDYRTVRIHPDGPWVTVEHQVCVRLCCWGKTGRSIRWANT